MYPSLIEIGSKTAEKNSAQTNKQTDKQTDRETDTTKIMDSLGREPKRSWNLCYQQYEGSNAM